MFRTSQGLAADTMNDYRLIRLSRTYQRLSPSDTKAWHSRSDRKLREFLVGEDPACTFVVTHHAPSIQSIFNRYRSGSVSAAFASNMDDFILEHQPRLCIHGHTHGNSQFAPQGITLLVAKLVPAF